MDRRELPNYGVVLPTYNTRDLTLKSLKLLLESRHPPTTVAVIDNGNDGTADQIERSHPVVHVVRNTQNVGFAAAINEGSRFITEPFMLWLNSDILLDPGDTRALLETLERRSDLGAVAPRQLSLDGNELPTVHRFPSALRPFRRSVPRLQASQLDAHEFLSGACLLIRRSAWSATGQLDDSFFFYWEESDWQFRARKLGWELALADVTVRHVGGGSMNGQSTTLRLLSSEGYERFILKHEGRTALLLHRFTNLPGVLWDLSGAVTWRALAGHDGLDQDARTARARLAQILHPVPPRGRSPWAARARLPR